MPSEAATTPTPLKKFEADLYFTQYHSATVIIEAATLGEALDKAGDIGADEVNNWEPVDGEVGVISVEPLEKGKKEQ
jgi:hypothetical protein